MKWSDNKPTEPGWYWMKEFKDSMEEVVQVCEDGNMDGISFIGYPLPDNAKWSTKLQEPE